MNYNNLISHLKKCEGTGPYDAETDTYFPYQDSVGVWTIGYGHNLEAKGIKGDRIEGILRDDIQDALDACERLDYWDRLDSVRQLVVASMVFNLGAAGWGKFVNTQAALRMGDYTYAAREMENSAWYRQTGRRARKLVFAMKTGCWDD